MTDKEKRAYTPARQFRLDDQAVANLDEIAEFLTAETGTPHTRSDAVRVAIRTLWMKVRRQKGSKKRKDRQP